MKHYINIYFLLSFAILFSCKKDEPPTLPNNNISVTTNKRLIICDEGNFGQSNANLSVYAPSNNAVNINAFSSENPNYTLGDVAQSIDIFNNKYYIVVNNSGKIVICNDSLQKQSVITGLISPRYIEFVSNNKAYISNLQLNNTQPNYIQVIDLNSNIITKSIRLDGWSEEMITSYGKTYITNQTKKYLYVIDNATDIISDSIFLNSSANCIIKDENEKIWVSCNNSKIIKINPVTNTVEDSVSVLNPISRLCINGNGTTLYYLANDVYKFDISTKTTTRLIQQGTRTFYGLCIDPDNETIYVSDARDYNSNGFLYRYNQTSLVGTYTVGVNPGFMLTDKN